MSSRGRIANLARYIFVDGRMGRKSFLITSLVCLGVAISLMFLVLILIAFGLHYMGEDIVWSAEMDLKYPLASVLITYFTNSVFFLSPAVILLAGIPRMRSMGLGQGNIINLLYFLIVTFFWVKFTVMFEFWGFAVAWEKILQQIVFAPIGNLVSSVFWLWLLCLLLLPVGAFHKSED